MGIEESLLRNIIMSLIVFNLTVSLLLLFRPSLLIGANKIMSKWFSTSKFDETMNKRRDIDQSIMGLGKFLGIISLISSIILIYFYTKL